MSQQNSSSSDSASASSVQKRNGLFLMDRYPSHEVAGTVNHKANIFRAVPHQLRQVNNNAYEPELVSIGPYHYGKEYLKEMEVYKQSFVDSIKPKLNWEELNKYVDDNIDRARKCYPPGVKSEKEMMLRDGCFVVILLCEMAAEFHTFRWKWDIYIAPFLRLRWVVNALYHDLLLLENQLPFFVLEDLYRYFVMHGLYQPEDGKDDFASLALLVLSKLMPGPNKWVDNCKRNSTIRDTHIINNLLSLVHNNWSPSPRGIESRKTYLNEKKKETKKEEESMEEGGQDKWKLKQCAVDEESGLTDSTIHNCLNWKFTCCRKEKKNVRKGLVEWQSIRTATELDEAGIKFLKSTSGINVESLFDISFKDATMEIPTFEIDGYTERLFRNLIAFELNEEVSTYVIDYVTLMDNLINSAKDVQLLRFSGVIQNILGDDEVVAQMINKLRSHVTLSGDKFYYEETFVGLKRHCAKRRNMWKAKLSHDYCNSPWALISVLAALLIILLSVGQFVTGLLQVTAPK